MAKKKDHDAKTAAEMLESALTFLKRSGMFWKRSFLVFFLVCLAAIPGVFLKPRIYKSETTFLYQEKISAQAIGVGEGNGEGAARRIGAKLRERLLARESLKPIVEDIPRYQALAERRGMVDAVEELRGHINFNAREGDTFAIGYEGPSPEEAQEVTRRLADIIVKSAENEQLGGTKATKELLTAQSRGNKAKLDETQATFSALLQQHPELYRLMPAGQGGGSSTAGGAGMAPMPPIPPAGTKDPVLYSMEVEKATLERRLRASSGEAPPTTAPVREESQEVKDARKNYQDKLAMYTPQHPDVIAAKRQLDTALANDAKRAPPKPDPVPVSTTKLTDAERDQIESRIKELRGAIARHKAGQADTTAKKPASPAGSGSAAPVPTQPASVALEVEFRRLQREVESLKENQAKLDDKLFKAELALMAGTGDGNVLVKILDPAYKPAHPSSKSRSSQLLMFLGIAVVLALLLALVSARLDDRIHAVDDLEVLDVLPVVGVIPRADGASRRRRAA